MNSSITGIGWVTATGMGCGKDEEIFDMVEGTLPRLTRKTAFNQPCQRFGRMDNYTRLGLSAIAFALKDAGIENWEGKRNIGIIASTINGCLDTDIRYYDTVIPEAGKLTSPNLFAYTLPSSFIGEAAIKFGLTGVSFVISEPSYTSLWCLRMALINLAGGQVEKILSGVCDLTCPHPYSKFGRKVPGALFFLIEKMDSRAAGGYGKLSLAGNGDIAFNGKPVKDLLNLTRDCINAWHKKSLKDGRTLSEKGLS